jgi:pimeloyl-ACP methyl ester carboxylesterase
MMMKRNIFSGFCYACIRCHRTRYYLLTGLMILWSFFTFSQLPVDNPYYYGRINENHWTNHLKWRSVTDVSKVKGVVDTKGKVDSLRIHQLIKKLSLQGGGVLYFPAGVYYFNYDLRLETGVILRGADPVGILYANRNGFSPPTKFEFTKYKPLYSGNGGNNDGFKSIYGDTVGISNAGLVNLDINRATIHFFAGGYHKEYTLQGTSYWSKYQHNNIVVIGIRHNNAAMPCHDIPTRTQIEKNGAWQRWPSQFIGNINVFVSGNCVVANCRINDNTTDDFEQPGYIDNQYSLFTGKQATFSYINHPGICVNAYKVALKSGAREKWGRAGPYVSLQSAAWSRRFKDLNYECEPGLITKGIIEIVDNYVYCKAQHNAIAVATGMNVIRYNNVLNMDTEKQFLHISGKRTSYESEPAYMEGLFEKRKFSTGTADTLHYRIHQPAISDSAKKYPLLVYLHGEELNGSGNTKQFTFFVPMLFNKDNQQKYPCYVIAPQNSYPSDSIGWVDFKDETTFEKDLILTKKLIDKIIAGTPNIDKNRIYIAGLSRGGTGAFKLAGRYPGVFAAVVALDGLEWPFTEQELENLKDVGLYAAVPRPYGFISLFQITRLNTVYLKQRGNKNVVFNVSEGEDRTEMVSLLGKDDKFFNWLFSNALKNN